AGAGAEAALAALTDGNFFDVVFDATGNAGSIENSFAYVAHTGSYVLVSVVNERISFADPEFHKREMRLIGSRNALADDFERVLAAMRAGQAPTKALATHQFPLAELPRMMPALIAPTSGVVKALVAL
ncbi:MAG: dehydrogenase, partial [Salinarimonadaceae bacterium]